jgi:hypothetical protein
VNGFRDFAPGQIEAVIAAEIVVDALPAARTSSQGL